MEKKLQHVENLIQIYRKSIESVQPKNLLSEENKFHLKPLAWLDGETDIEIKGRVWNAFGKNCHIIGFGEGVIGMAVHLENLLQYHLKSGILSVPMGTLHEMNQNYKLQLKNNTCIQVIEGAVNNKADYIALQTATKIMKLASSMTSNDILFVLITDGGSNLLPLPKLPCTLKEKKNIIKNLSTRGATNVEINTVRISLSAIKGGQLAKAASNAAAVISFVLNDNSGESVELVSGGPTCAPNMKGPKAANILYQYGLWNNLPKHIKCMLENASTKDDIKLGDNNHVYVIGDNVLVTDAIVEQAQHYDYRPFVLTTTLQDEVQDIVKILRKFLNNIMHFRNMKITEDKFMKVFPFDSSLAGPFLRTLLMCEKSDKPLLLIMAGSPKVNVSGCGKGGQNQEFCLRMSQVFYEKPLLTNCCALSCGTSGTDGTTPAAGAIASRLVIDDFLFEHTPGELEEYIDNNDSYNFYKSLNNGEFQIMTGLTGTNVKDIQMILVL